MGLDPKDVDVTVIGGHAGITILPLFSRVNGAKFTGKSAFVLFYMCMQVFIDCPCISCVLTYLFISSLLTS